ATRSRQERALRLRTDGLAAPVLRWSDWPAVVPTLAVVVGVIGLPLAALVTRSLATPEGWGLHNYQLLGIAGSAGVSVWAAAATSLATATQAALLAVTLGLMVSFVLSRRPRTALGQRAQQVLDSLFMLPLGVSAVTVGFGFLVALNRPPLDLRSSTILIPIAQAVVALPLVVRTLLPVLRALDPRQLEAAATLGAGPWRVAATIEGPYALRGLGLALGFAFATSLGEFGATSFLARPDTPTLPVLIFHLIGRPGADNQGMALAACVMLALVTGTVMAAAETLGHGEARGW
ncbi:MAG: ABC transporter permease subunit, partial [Propionibacteriaceae bacterium]